MRCPPVRGGVVLAAGLLAVWLAGCSGSAPMPVGSGVTTTAAPTPTPTVPVPSTTAHPVTTARPPGLAPPRGWTPRGRRVDGSAAVYVAARDGLRVAWFDTTRLRMRLIGGTLDPGGPGDVAPAQRRSLVAAFNSGFKFSAGAGGYYVGRRTYARLLPGAASLVILPDGRVAIGPWGETVGWSLHPIAVRQNLRMLVDHGRPTAAVYAEPYQAWGATLGGGIDVWRSAVGVSAHGALLFAAGPTTPLGLAQAMVAAGAVRAMELDINPEWVLLGVYVNQGHGIVGLKVFGSSETYGSRYLYPWTRDFFALFAR